MVDGERYPNVSKDFETILKRKYPESHKLDIDRTRTARKVYPATDEGIKKWSKAGKNRADIKGFDTRLTKDETVKRVLKDLKSATETDYVARQAHNGVAANCFVTEDFVLGRLLAEQKDLILDKDSLEQAMKDAWSKDPNAKELTKFFTQADIDVMWAHPLIQQYVNRNLHNEQKPILVQYIMQRYGVEPNKAVQVFNRLSDSQRAQLVLKVRKGRLPKFVLPRRPQGRLRWSEQELNIIRHNRDMSVQRLAELFNRTSRVKRSFGAVRSKLYQVRKEQR